MRLVLLCAVFFFTANVCLAGRITGPIVLSLYNPVMPQFSINLVLPNTEDGIANDTANWEPLGPCVNGIGRLSWAKKLYANMTGIDQNHYADVKTFGALYNSNGKLSGFVHATLSNMSYDFTEPAVYWIKIPANSATYPQFNFPADQWIHMIHFENTTSICSGGGMPKNYQGAGDIVIINANAAMGGTRRRYPYNKTDGRELLFVHAPTGDSCVPMMGCHWFDPLGGTPTYPQWVAGFDVYGELQFTEIMTQVPQPIYGTQWELVPAGAIPEFGNIDWFFRHVHVKDPMEGCANPCAANRDDCHPDATCVQDVSQAPYFRCTCNLTAPNAITTNNGRGPNGCTTCPVGKIPSVDRRLCIDACSHGFVADTTTGACIDVDDCASSACAGDETCVNLHGTPYACVYSQVAGAVSTWTQWVQSQSLTQIEDILAPSGGVVLLSFSLGKRAELILTVAVPDSITDSEAAEKLSAASGQTLTAVYDANSRLIVTNGAASDVDVVDATNNAVALLATASSVVLAVSAALF